MGSLTPPWADELRARNSKIAKKMMSSLSIESYFEPENQDQSNSIKNGTPPSPQRCLSVTSPTVPVAAANGVNGGISKKVVDPSTGRMASSQSPTSSKPSAFLNNTRRVKRQQHGRNTEKLSPIRNERDSMFDEDTSQRQ
ncbi:hypothetical protein Ocin01_07746 [Orchesella cincta]|uniref:Uncharacterized protein n=1 Tax=Orchesella cincta TaxID=48709 RepID=A0A1D2N210_ORCCI|nr:hypothetical protein Ocin01_07746 [Orchesella cincta]